MRNTEGVLKFRKSHFATFKTHFFLFFNFFLSFQKPNKPFTP